MIEALYGVTHLEMKETDGTNQCDINAQGCSSRYKKVSQNHAERISF